MREFHLRSTRGVQYLYAGPRIGYVDAEFKTFLGKQRVAEQCCVQRTLDAYFKDMSTFR